jgi:hypothetical protein
MDKRTLFDQEIWARFGNIRDFPRSVTNPEKMGSIVTCYPRAEKATSFPKNGGGKQRVLRGDSVF